MQFRADFYSRQMLTKCWYLYLIILYIDTQSPRQHNKSVIYRIFVPAASLVAASAPSDVKNC